MPFYFVAISEKRHDIHRGALYSGQHILPNDFKHIEYTEICSKFMDESMKNFAIRLIITTLGVFAMNYGSWHAFFIEHIVATSLDCRVPFTGERSYGEFYVNIAIHSSYLVCGSLGFVGMEIALELFTGVVAIAPKLIALEFRKLANKIEEKTFTELQIRVTYRNIVQQIMDIDELVKSSKIIHLVTILL